MLPKPIEPLLDFMGTENTSSQFSTDTAVLEGKLFEMASMIENRDQSLCVLREIVSIDLVEKLSALPFERYVLYVYLLYILNMPYG